MFKPKKSRTHGFHVSTLAQAFLDAGVVENAPMVRSAKATVTDRKTGKVRNLNVSTPGAFGRAKEEIVS